MTPGADAVWGTRVRPPVPWKVAQTPWGREAGRLRVAGRQGWRKLGSRLELVLLEPQRFVATGYFYAPRPIVDGEITRPEHPVFYGYDGKTLPLKYANGPLLQVPEADREDRPAIVEVPLGAGAGG